MAPRKMAEERIRRISSSPTVLAVSTVVSTTRLSPSQQAEQPRERSMSIEASTSRRWGQRRSSTVSPTRMVAARMGSTAFFAPWMSISPDRGLPPRMISSCMKNRPFAQRMESRSILWAKGPFGHLQIFWITW